MNDINELIDNVVEAAKNNLRAWDRSGDTHSTQKELAAARQALLAAYPRWVPVEERLPEAWTYVLIAYPNGSVLMAEIGDGEDTPHWYLPHGWLVESDITHWQPLPSVPETEEK